MSPAQIPFLLLTLLVPSFAMPMFAHAQALESTPSASEFDVLARYVGTWDVVAGTPEEPLASGSTTAKLILDGKFVQGTGSVQSADGSNDFDVVTMMTYDPSRKAFRRWSFFSFGMTSVADGTWDDETQSMTWVNRYGNVVQKTTSTFAAPGVEKWTMISTDEAGKTVHELQGTNTRR